ncbi:MAG: hypothetical protein KME64_00810 [Scytonematopsis contorta HA4267-MV1]|jgi:kynurenine formamidase|nr:hypothetical protein [Scytonematopsis contorta HA4267-MV1]
MSEPVRNKEEFDNWIKSIVLDLKLEDFSFENFTKLHWKKLWTAYDKYQAQIPQTKIGEMDLLKNSFYDEIKAVVLDAHNMDESDYLQSELMDNYLNSSSYN